MRADEKNDSEPALRLGAVLDETLAEGPGLRFAVWVQGCSLRCPGCCNPHLFDTRRERTAARDDRLGVSNEDAQLLSVGALLERLSRAQQGFAVLGRRSFECQSLEHQASHRLEGVTLLGGEPFEQAEALSLFARGAHALGLSVMTFSGYTLEELRAPSAPACSAALLAETDLLVDGRYDQRQPERARRWAGSQNQRFHFLTSRYAPGLELIAHGEVAQTVEVRIGGDGRALVSGWPEQLALGRRTNATRAR